MLPLRSAQDVLEALHQWLDTDEPLVKAVGHALQEYQRCDLQEQARRAVHAVISVLEANLAPAQGRDHD